MIYFGVEYVLFKKYWYELFHTSFSCLGGCFMLIVHGLFPNIWEWKTSELICEQDHKNN